MVYKHDPNQLVSVQYFSMANEGISSQETYFFKKSFDSRTTAPRIPKHSTKYSTSRYMSPQVHNIILSNVFTLGSSRHLVPGQKY